MRALIAIAVVVVTLSGCASWQEPADEQQPLASRWPASAEQIEGGLPVMQSPQQRFVPTQTPVTCSTYHDPLLGSAQTICN